MVPRHHTGALVQHTVRRSSGRVSNVSPIRKRKVRFDTKYAPGTIVSSTHPNAGSTTCLSRGRAMKYGIGVGRDGFQWSGKHRITRKAEWPRLDTAETHDRPREARNRQDAEGLLSRRS